MAKRKNVIAPNDEKSLVAMEKMSADIIKARELYGDGEPYEEERVLDCIVFRYKRAGCEIEAMGKYCKWYRTEVGHGRFLEGLKRRNVDVRDAYYAMAMVEKFGAEFGTVPNLGVRKARCLTRFTKEEIDEYVKGGPLKSIPHDDVANMTATELETEVRKLRGKLNRAEEVTKERIRQKDEQIDKLEMEASYRQPPTKEQIAHAALQKLSASYILALTGINGKIREAYSIVCEAEKTPGVNVQQLNEWLGLFNNEMRIFDEVKQSWLDEVDNVTPIEVGKIREA
jgi:hypothetical protein